MKRNILCCKKCPYFKPYLIAGKNTYPFQENGLLSGISSGSDKYLTRRRVHSCDIDDYGVCYGDYKPEIEYFNLPYSADCPYYMEHYLYEIYKAEKDAKCDYSIKRLFKRKRVCQHCGHTIPNVRECPVCGFLRFKVYNGLNEMALFYNIFIIIVLLIAIFILKAFTN